MKNGEFKIEEKDGKFIVMVATKKPFWKFWGDQLYVVCTKKDGSLCEYPQRRYAQAYIIFQGKK